MVSSFSSASSQVMGCQFPFLEDYSCAPLFPRARNQTGRRDKTRCRSVRKRNRSIGRRTWRGKKRHVLLDRFLLFLFIIILSTAAVLFLFFYRFTAAEDWQDVKRKSPKFLTVNHKYYQELTVLSWNLGEIDRRSISLSSSTTCRFLKMEEEKNVSSWAVEDQV